MRLPGKENSNSHDARPVHLIITMIKWIRTSRLSIKNPLSSKFRPSFFHPSLSILRHYFVESVGTNASVERVFGKRGRNEGIELDLRLRVQVLGSRVSPGVWGSGLRVWGKGVKGLDGDENTLGGFACPFSSHRMYLSITFRKSTYPRNRQHIFYYYYSEYQVDSCVRDLTFQN